MAAHFAQRLVRAVTAFALIAASVARPAPADQFEETYQHILRSLAFIETQIGNVESRGTGFVIASTPPGVEPEYSYILTAGHVVGSSRYAHVTLNDVFPPPDLDRGVHDDGRIDGDVMFVDYDGSAPLQNQVDLALIRIKVGGLTPVFLPYEAVEGTSVGVAGYPPSSMLSQGRLSNLRPVVHSGIVASVRENGGLIEHTAVTDHGISGGPLFESDNGGVIGVIHGEWCPDESKPTPEGTCKVSGVYLAVGYRVIFAFRADADACLRSGQPSVKGAQRCYATAADIKQHIALPSYSQVATRYLDVPLPGAYSLLYLHDAAMPQQLVQNLPPTLPSDLQHELSSQITEHPISVIDADPGGVQFDYIAPEGGDPAPMDGQLAKLCTTQALDAIVVHGSIVPPDARYPQPRLWLWLSLMSCTGTDWTFSRSLGDAVSIPANGDVSAVEAQVGKSLLSALDDYIAARPLSFDDYVRYGLYMPEGEPRTYFNFGFDDTHKLVVQWVIAGGCAARAGIKVGDVITNLNGHAILPDTTDSDLDKYRNEYHAVWNLEIDGKTVSFSPEDLRWMVAHRDSNEACKPL